MDVVDSSAQPPAIQDFIRNSGPFFNAPMGAGLAKTRHPITPPLMTGHEILHPHTPPPLTPSTTDETSEPHGAMYKDPLSAALHVLQTQAAGLAHIANLYARDPVCGDGFVRAVEAIVSSQRRDGRVIVVGVGKSGKIGHKLVATMISLGVHADFLDAVEALHGDLGKIKKNDVILMITYSGKTAELRQLLPHISTQHPLIAMTGRMTLDDNSLFTRGRENTILLPAPIHEAENISFGVSAPTTSTTVAMSLGDALALVCAYQIHRDPGQGPKEVFTKNHPGGAIGQVNLAQDKRQTGRLRELVVQYENMLPVNSFNHSIGGLPTPALSETSSESDLDLSEWNTTTEMDAPMAKSLTVLDCLRLAVKSPKGWLRTHDNCVIPPRRLQNFDNVMANALSPEFGVTVDLNDRKQLLFSVEDDTAKVASALSDRKALGEVTDDTVVAVVDCGKVIGAVEVGTILEHASC